MNKVIENKQTVLKLNETQNVTYADLLATVINKPVKEAIDLKSMKRNLNLLDKFEKAEETIELTEDEFTFIAKEVEESKWVVNHKDIVNFAEYIESLK